MRGSLIEVTLLGITHTHRPSYPIGKCQKPCSGPKTASRGIINALMRTRIRTNNPFLSMLSNSLR